MMKTKIILNKDRWQIPQYVVLTCGKASGFTELTAFDNALLDAGIGNLNLVKVTSVLPPKAKVLRLDDCDIELPLGSVIPTVYTRMIDATKGITISSAIGVGIPKDDSLNGMIFESSISGPKDRAAKLVNQMILEAFSIRNVELKEVIVVATEIEAQDHIACTMAAALLL